MTDQQPYERAGNLTKKQIIVNNLLGGLCWGIGLTVGLSLFFFLLTILAKEINLVPVVGTFVSDVINYILATNPHMQH